MIARIWRGRTPRDKSDAYAIHLRDNIFPELAALPGHMGAFVMRRPEGNDIAFTVMTLWDSVEAIRAFAGNDVEAAVVPAEAQALLSQFDDRAQHWEIPLARLVTRLDNLTGGDAK